MPTASASTAWRRRCRARPISPATPISRCVAAAPWVDFGTASLLALGVMAALRAREQTGRGQLVEGALLRTALTFFSTMLIEEAVLKLDREPSLNRSQTAAPSDIYRTKDGWIMVAVNGDPLFRRVAKLVGAPEWLEDPRFASDKSRGDHGEIMSERMSRNGARNARATKRSRPSRRRAFRRDRSMSMRETLDDPHVRAAGFFTEIDFPGSARAPIAATPVKLHDTPGEMRTRPPFWASTMRTCCGSWVIRAPKSKRLSQKELSNET